MKGFSELMDGWWDLKRMRRLIMKVWEWVG